MSPRNLKNWQRFSEQLRSAGDLNDSRRIAELEEFRRILVGLCGEDPAILMTLESEIRSYDDLAEVPFSDYLGWILAARHGAIYKAEGGGKTESGFKCLAAFGTMPTPIQNEAILPQWLLRHGPLVRSDLTFAGLTADEAEGLVSELDELDARLVAPIMLNHRLWGFLVAGPSMADDYRGGESLYLSLYGLSLISSLERRRQGLPTRAVSDAQKEAQALREAQQMWMSLRPRQSKLKLLILDEEAETTTSLSRFLEGWGIEVTGAASEEEALDRVRRLRPHLLLIDVGLRHRFPTKFLEAVRILIPEAVILATTASRQGPAKELVEKFRIEQIFRKPCRFSRLALSLFEAALGAAMKPMGIPYPRMESCLIIDQDKEATAALREYFEARGSRVWVADSADSAVSLIARAKPRLIILDQKVPGDSELKLIPRIRAASPKSRLIMLTNSIEELPAKSARKVPAPDARALKPVPIHEIDRLVEDLLLAPLHA